MFTTDMLPQATIQLHYKQNYTKAAPAIKQHCTPYTECDQEMSVGIYSHVRNKLVLTGLPWIWISMDISMCGYET